MAARTLQELYRTMVPGWVSIMDPEALHCLLAWVFKVLEEVVLVEGLAVAIH